MSAFQSILFGDWEPGVDVDSAQEPDCFDDLRLNRVVDAVTAGRDEYRLRPFFYVLPREVGLIDYRHSVLRDLERDEVRGPVEEFAQAMRHVRERRDVMDRLYYSLQKQRWFLDAVDGYCAAVTSLADRLGRVELGSAGMRTFREHVLGYRDGHGFRTLAAECRMLRADLAKIRYCVLIRGLRVTVNRYAGEADFSAEVEKTFGRFAGGAVADPQLKVADHAVMNHVEGQILDRVAQLFPHTFGALDEFCAQHGGFLDPALARFDREVQFYLGYLSFMRRFGRSDLRFCYPEVSDRGPGVAVEDGFDLALAAKLVPDGEPVVRNSFRLAGAERVIVVTGPNQGGKTTFARMFGQLPYLAGLGLPVPASAATLFLPDRVFAHFEREESVTTLRGKFEDELVRIRAVLDQASNNSVLVLNESFNSTTLDDARFIGTRVLERIIRLGAPTVYVTFVDELAALDESVVSMVAAIAPEGQLRRTYEITRRPANGIAYATALADHYGLSYEVLKGRIRR